MSGVPVVGSAVLTVAQVVASPIASWLFNATGKQFFLDDDDGHPSGEPLLLRMTRGASIHTWQQASHLSSGIHLSVRVLLLTG